MTISNEIPYGLRREGEKEFFVHISEIKSHERGLRCNCVCPKCHAKLQAKLPKYDINYTPRFAHHDAEICESALETVLHMKAKEIIESEKYINVPRIVASYKDKVKEISKEGQLRFDSVSIEHELDDIIPDLLCSSKNHQLIIEIKVTHGIDNVKLEKIKKHNISTIEIDLSKNSRNFDSESLYNEIIVKTDNKRWIYNTAAENEKKLLKENYLKQEEELKKKKLEKQSKEFKEKRHNGYREKFIEPSVETGLLRQLIKNQDELGKKFKAEQLREDIVLPKDKIIKKFLDINYQEKLRRKWDNEFHINESWKSLAYSVNISIDKIPQYINQEIPGEILFGCDRRIWQLYIFCKFIYKKAGESKEPISLYPIREHIRKDFRTSLIDVLVFKVESVEYEDIPCLNDVIFQYLKTLERHGYLEELPTGDVKYERWIVLDPFR